MMGQLMLAVISFCGALLFFHADMAEAKEKTVYAIFWRGCEELCEGFQNYFVEREIDAKIFIRDAAQDKSKIPLFLEEARAMNADLILSWGTSVTMGIAGKLKDVENSDLNNDIPQVFTAVADPVGAGIIESLENTGRRNITGTFNRVPEAVNINTIRSYLPEFKRLGLLYNRNERNSVLKKEELAELAKVMDFELIAIELPIGNDGKPQSSDIPVKLAELKEKKADFIYLGSSSFLDTNRDLFTGSAVENGIPVLSPYERLVRNSQGLLSIAARYQDVGRLAGQLAERILIDGETPGDIPVAHVTDFAYVINMDVARKLNLFPPVEILQFAETVN
jgi:ABC-type uncharacterized transport system substrate-binding protein